MRKPNGASRKPAQAALMTATLMTAVLAAAATAGAAHAAPASPPTPGPTSAPAAAPAPAAVPLPAPAPYIDPAVPGVCVLSQKALFANSLVGRSVTARLQQLQQQIQAGLMKEKRSLESAAKALQAERSTLPPIQMDAKQRALSQRADLLQSAAAQKNQQLEVTQSKVTQRIAQEAQPAVAAAYQARHCGVLFDRAAVITGGAGLDITEAVIQALDAKITTLTFNLEPPPESSGN